MGLSGITKPGQITLRADAFKAQPSQIVSPGGTPLGEPVNMLYGGGIFPYSPQPVYQQSPELQMALSGILANAEILPSYLDSFIELSMHGDTSMSLRERFSMMQFANARLYTEYLQRAHDPDDATERSLPLGLSRDPYDLIFLKNNVIPIKGIVDDRMADDVSFMAQHILGAMKRSSINKPVHFLINSPGGSVVAKHSILEDMDKLKNATVDGKPVIVATYCNGMAASAASVIFANGSKGYRLIGPYSEYMIHQPRGWAGGRATDIDISTKRIEKFKKRSRDLFERVTGLSQEVLYKLLEEDRYMTADEAIAYGFADGKYESYAMDSAKDFDLESLFKKSGANSET